MREISLVIIIAKKREACYLICECILKSDDLKCFIIIEQQQQRMTKVIEENWKCWERMEFPCFFFVRWKTLTLFQCIRATSTTIHSSKALCTILLIPQHFNGGFTWCEEMKNIEFTTFPFSLFSDEKMEFLAKKVNNCVWMNIHSSLMFDILHCLHLLFRCFSHWNFLHLPMDNMLNSELNDWIDGMKWK